MIINIWLIVVRFEKKMRNLHINRGEKAQTELYCTRYDV